MAETIALKAKKVNNIKILLYRLFVILFVLIMIFPFIWIVMASLKTQAQMMSTSNIFIFKPTLENYIKVFSQYNFITPIKNSLIIAFLSTLFSLVLGLPAAYAIARYNMKRFAIVILIVRMIPVITFLVPWYILFTQIELIDTYTVVILSHMLMALPYIIWIMIPSFESLPLELEEAAMVDGSRKINTFIKITIPLVAPGIMACSILSFINSWNNFIFGIILTGVKTKTLPVAIFSFIQYAAVDWSGLMAAATIIIFPIIIICLCLQKYIVTGLTSGAVKG